MVRVFAFSTCECARCVCFCVKLCSLRLLSPTISRASPINQLVDLRAPRVQGGLGSRHPDTTLPPALTAYPWSWPGLSATPATLPRSTSAGEHRFEAHGQMRSPHAGMISALTLQNLRITITATSHSSLLPTPRMKAPSAAYSAMADSGNDEFGGGATF